MQAVVGILIVVAILVVWNFLAKAGNATLGRAVDEGFEAVERTGRRKRKQPGTGGSRFVVDADTNGGEDGDAGDRAVEA